jgi:soluble lytic murein transglycosylase
VKLRTAKRLPLILAAAVTAAACSDGHNPPPVPERERLLDQAFAVADSNPARAITLFADAGPGASLENSRMAVWADCLERSNAEPDEWRRYLEDRPPTEYEARARLALIKALVDRGEIAAAVGERSLLPAASWSEADELLFAAGDPDARAEAALRLAISSPSFLAAVDPALDRQLTSKLSPSGHLDRARAWRRDGQPSRSASELRRAQWTGEDEKMRRRELARADIAAGSPSRALSTLPSGSKAEAEDMVLRAQAYRNRGWHLFPGRGEHRFFRDCVEAAESAIALDGGGDQRQASLALRLECSTQIGQLDIALESWRLLEAGRWDDPRREWFGRRLGIALIRSMPDSPAIAELARGLPSQERCLRYWMATSSADSGPGMIALADAGVADLYGQWSREAVARTTPEVSNFGQPVLAGRPPPSVDRLLVAGSKREALREWRRIRRSRSATPAEALAAAELAADNGWSTDSIRWLLSGFPSLGTVDMVRAAENAVRAYLPLRWRGAVTAAARETGLDPWLIAGVARQESGFVAHAASPQGAIGVLQLLPSTARLHARALGLGSQPDLRDPEVNIRLGARELGALMRRFGAVEPALAAYNGGLTRVRGWWKQWPDRQRFTEEIPVPETYNYVRRVVYLSEAYRLAYDEEWRKAQ